jgi:hypothetical protein
MKQINIISIILLSVFISSCTENNVTESTLQEGINFYFLKDSTITANQISAQNIYDLKIADKPFLTYKDLLYYNWEEHSFGIDSNKAKVIQNICESRPTVFGIPFIITVDQERIYLGAFWYSYSSLAPTFPYIDALFNLGQTPQVLSIQKSWDSTKPDLRSDKRIYNALIKYNLLVK